MGWSCWSHIGRARIGSAHRRARIGAPSTFALDRFADYPALPLDRRRCAQVGPQIVNINTKLATTTR
ncbi:serine protease PepA domain protein [Mycobacterium kansasii]|uniref:Serine protease PepA domain protein n=1 Tax=Mycobacterium kansasii TaxID=1768 RepID=A0A1V3WB22_MYCKA|nr:serine protease PepA domain protein [Mycobacterium kansasii]